MNYYSKYLKYKKKYLELKNLELKNLIVVQSGGGKRYLKQEIDKDPLILTPTGMPNKMNKFLLQPEINFIKKKCSNNKSIAKICTDQNISDLLTYFFTSEHTGYNPSKDLEIISKKTKLSKDFVSSVLKYHKIWKSEFLLKIEK
jgi:hypothetical protein